MSKIKLNKASFIKINFLFYPSYFKINQLKCEIRPLVKPVYVYTITQK